MAKLRYGGGNCIIENNPNIRGAVIRYEGAINIDKTCGDNFVITHQKDGIMIFPIGVGNLTTLFKYEGYFKIKSVLLANENNEKESCTIFREMHHANLISSNAEDITLNSEDLGNDYRYNQIRSKTSLKVPYLANLRTSDIGEPLYLEDNTIYSGGRLHIHLNNNLAMTGAKHGSDSQELYFKRKERLISTKNMTGKKLNGI